MQPKMLYMRKTPVESAAIVYLLVAGLVMIPYDWLGAIFTENETVREFLGVGILRLLSFAVLAALAFHMAIRNVFLPRRGEWKALLFAVPALVIAVNNLPVVALASGTATVTASAGIVAAFALNCVGVALFEETAFRGIIFPFILGKTGTGVKGRFIAVVASGAAFGLLHLINLFGGFSGAVFLQVGYSFLIGCMLAVVMFRGAGVLVCAFIHAVYNFCGFLVPKLGEGTFRDIWCAEEIVLTAVVAVAVAVFYVLLLRKCSSVRAEEFAAYPLGTETKEKAAPAAGEPADDTEKDEEPRALVREKPSASGLPEAEARGDEREENGKK